MPGIILTQPASGGGGSPSGPTKLDTFAYVSSNGAPSLIQFSGGGLPTEMSLSGVGMQLDVLERKPNGDSRVFRAIAPIAWPTTAPGVPGSGTELVAIETDPGAPHALDGIYPANSDPALLSFTLSNARGSYVSSIATALTTEILVGVGNLKGNSGPDYLRMTRYFCPFKNSAETPGSLHEFCGAMVVTVTQRVDLDGYIAEVMFSNGALESPHITYNGNQPENPGFVVYSAITLNKGVAGVTVLHADTFTGGTAEGTGPTGSYLVSPFTGTKRHLSAPGTLPGWMFAVYNALLPTLSAARVVSMMEGAGCSMGYEGRGFSARSAFGFGVNEIRHSDPRDWNSQMSFQNERLRANDIVSRLKAQIQTGLGSVEGDIAMNGTRSGVWHCLGPLNPNHQGGEMIAGHAIMHTTSAMLPYWRLAAMMSSRRVNHAFYAWNKGQPLLPADCLVSAFDISPDVNAAVDVCVLHHNDNDGGISNRLPSTQFASVSPRGFPTNPTDPNWPDPRYGGQAQQRYNQALPITPTTQDLNGPAGRTWNTLQSGEVLGSLFEDPSAVTGYSHNLAHSARFQHCREAWLFGLSGIGYEIAMTFGAFAASYHNAWEPAFAVPTQQDWVFGRATRNLHAWGFRDLPGMVEGGGDMIARRRNGSGSLGSLTVGTGSTNHGRQSIGWHTNRTQAWSIWWQLQAAALGPDDYRDLTIGQDPEHNPAELVADLVSYAASEVGLSSSTIELAEPTQVSTLGACDFPNRRGAIPNAYSGTPNNNEVPPQLWTWTLDFHEVYWIQALDAVAKHVDAGKLATMQRSLVRVYWLHKQGAVVCDFFGLNRLGVSKYPPATAGTESLGKAHLTEPGNEPPTAASLIAGELRWSYRYPHNPYGVPGSVTTPSGYPDYYPEHDLGLGHDDENWLMGFVQVFRYGTTTQKQEALVFLARRYNLSVASTPAQIIAHIRSSLASGSVPSRRSSFDGEFETLVGLA